MIEHLGRLMAQAEDGLISYAEFIETALYHPEYGYYMRDTQKIGRGGDFITTSNISDIYGRSVAKWFAKVAQATGLPFEVCEVGAGSGRFAKSFIDEWSKSGCKPLKYTAVEASPYHRRLQRELLEGEAALLQAGSILELKDFEGLIFSNELFDAFPVHVLEKRGGELHEVKIGLKSGKLAEELVPLDNTEVFVFLEKSGLELRDGQRVEVPLLMGDVYAGMAGILQKGLIVTVDYGYTNEDWAHPARKRGSLRGYAKHKMIDNVLENPGEMDITSHIHFDMLEQTGAENGLETIAKLRQDEFFLSIGLLKELEDNYDPNPFSEKARRNRAIRSLVLPTGMSASFDVLIQQKGMGASREAIFPSESKK